MTRENSRFSLPTVLHAKSSKVRDRKLQKFDAGFRGLNDKITHSFFETPERRTDARSARPLHQPKLPINSCVHDENAIR